MSGIGRVGPNRNHQTALYLDTANPGKAPDEGPVKCKHCEAMLPWDGLWSHFQARHKAMAHGLWWELHRVEKKAESWEGVTGHVGRGSDLETYVTARPRVRTGHPQRF